jgi:serine protease Do
MVHRGYLGVEVRALDPDVAARLGVPNDEGILVAKVMPETPAAKAGIKAGDVILKAADKPMKDTADLQRLVAGLPLKKDADITVLRDGKTMTLHATIEEQPKDFGVALPKQPVEPGSDTAHKETGTFGITLTQMTPKLAKGWGFDENTKGTLITAVKEGSPAADAGLRRGQLLTAIDDTPINTPDDAAAALKKASLDKGVLFKVRSAQDEVEFVMIKEKEVH